MLPGGGYQFGGGTSGGPEARDAFWASLIVLGLLTAMLVAFIFM